MQGAQFRRCLACHKSYVNPRLAERRCEYARHMLEKYPMPQDWYHVRWSDETHFGWGSEGRIWVLRRPWERDCPDCVVEDKQPPEKDLVRVHAWGAVGHNFKSPLVWYNSGNPNGKMTLQTYRDQIFEPVVGSWLRDGHNFVLEEDNDSGHGTGKSNIVRTWKKEAGLTSFFNCSHSPNIPPIEKAWLVLKNKTRSQAVWKDRYLKELAEEAWNGLSLNSINRWVDSVPDILEKIVDAEGKMTAYHR
ncbi:hypothetical protein RB598_008355 [Gaeumannomyces tritici]